MRELYPIKKKQSNTIQNKEPSMGNAERVAALLGASQVEMVYGERARDRNRIEKELEELALAGDEMFALIRRPMAPTGEITPEEYARDRWNQAKVKLMKAMIARPVPVNRNLDLPRYARYARWFNRSPQEQGEYDLATHGAFNEPFLTWVLQRMKDYEQWGGRMTMPGHVASQEDFDAYLDERLADRAAGKED